MKPNNEKLEELLETINQSANDANAMIHSLVFENDEKRWQMILGELDTIKYFVMDAKQIVRRRIKSAQYSVQRTAIQPAPIEEFVRDLKKNLESDDD